MLKRPLFQLLLFFSFAVILSCKKLRSPVVKTGSVIEVTSNSALATGTVVTAGFGRLNHVGFCIGKSPSPDINKDRGFETARMIGEFKFNINSLESNTTYYVRAFAENNAGVSYGNDLTFTTVKDWSQRASV